MNSAAILVAAALLAAPAAAADWTINPAKSRIAFAGSHAGNAFSGRFTRWSGSIRFDPAQPEAGRAVIGIDLVSATTGNRLYDGTLPQADWFNLAAGSQARFETAGIRAVAGKPGHYVADGTLRLRGVTVPVTLPFSLSIAGRTAVMQGAVTLNRLAFGIGKASDAAAAWVSRDIPVTVTVTATRR